MPRIISNSMLQFGKALSNAKATLKHREFSPWCLKVLKRSPSWCSAHRRLHESRSDLEPAIAWAVATGHRWAHCRSVERLLRIVADWRKATRGDCATAPRARRKERATGASIELEEIVAQLQKLLTEAEDAFETVRLELWMVAPSDHSARDDLMVLAKRFRSRLRDLVESCSALQLSKPIEAAADPPPIDDAVAAEPLQ